MERFSGAVNSLAFGGRWTRKPAHWTWRTCEEVKAADQLYFFLSVQACNEGAA